jgi:hypothetical protein
MGLNSLPVAFGVDGAKRSVMHDASGTWTSSCHTLFYQRTYLRLDFDWASIYLQATFLLLDQPTMTSNIKSLRNHS